MLQILFFPEQDGIGVDKPAFSLLDSGLEQIRIDGAFVDIEKRDVIESDFVEENDELYEVGVRLLPKGFLAPAEKVVEQRRNVVGEGVRIEVIAQGIVAVLGFQTDFHVVMGAAVARENFTDPR